MMSKQLNVKDELKVKDLEIFNSYFETYIVNIQSSEAATRGVL